MHVNVYKNYYEIYLIVVTGIKMLLFLLLFWLWLLYFMIQIAVVHVIFYRLDQTKS